MTPPNAGRDDADSRSPEQWARVRTIVEGAVALPADARSAFLDASCGADHSMRRRIDRLVAAHERADDDWGFLARSAGELVAPLLADANKVADSAARTDAAPAAFCDALADRYAVGAEIGRGGMATVYVAEDLRHQRRVAIKVLDPDLGVLLGAERFLSEIRVTASLRHPNLLPLFDSGEAGGLLYYVMPLIDGSTLRARLQREGQLPVDEAVRIVRVIAGALDYAHRQGVVHRDLKPENILLQDDQPLVADFGISLAVTRAASSRRTTAGISLGTPRYMSPEQAAGASDVDGRSDIYSLACVLYELLAGDPPFTGETAQVVIARVLAETPASVRTLRPSVPAQLDAVLTRALAKLPADRYATAREFGDALVLAPTATSAEPHASAAPWRRPVGLAMAGVVIVSAIWLALGRPAAPAEVTRIPLPDLIDQALFSAVSITPNGRALVYTGSAESGKPIMLLPLNSLTARPLAGTEEGFHPFVSPDGRQLAFESRDGPFKTISIDDGTATDVAVGGALRRFFRKSEAWRYGNGAWTDQASIVIEGGPGRGLVFHEVAGDTRVVLTRADTLHGENSHRAPLVLPGGRAVAFTVSMHAGPSGFSGPLAIASLDPRDSLAPYVKLAVEARRAIAFVDGRLLYASPDGRAIMAVRLDVEHRRIVGRPMSVLEEPSGNLETAALADNGTLLYVRHPSSNAPVLVDSTGAVHPLAVKPAGSLMYPRVSADGKRLAVQTTMAGAGNDLWLYDIATGTPTRLTTTGKAFHPTWSPDGRRIFFMAAKLSGLKSQAVDASDTASYVPRTVGGFAPMVAPDGKSVVFQRAVAGRGWQVWSAPTSGEGTARSLVDDSLVHYMPAVSPDGHWLAEVSSGTGRNEVYARPFPGPGLAVRVSNGGGAEPAWSPDGRHIYYRTRGAFMAVDVKRVGATTAALEITSPRQLFKDAFDGAMPHRNYDVMPDGSGFLMITGGSSEAVVVLNWLTELRGRFERVR